MIPRMRVIAGIAVRSAQLMSATAAPYVGWLYTTAEQTQQTAMQARAAAAAYELAFAMAVPPAVVAANRALLAALIATNFFGQNTPAIAATEAQYAEMWAQDAAAMTGYATTSAAAAQLSPFFSPRQTTNPAGLAAQDAAVSQANAGATATSPASQTVSAATPTAVNPASIIPTDLSILNVIQGAGTALSGTWKMEATPAGIIEDEKDLGMLPEPQSGGRGGPGTPAGRCGVESWRGCGAGQRHRNPGPCRHGRVDVRAAGLGRTFEQPR